MSLFVVVGGQCWRLLPGIEFSLSLPFPPSSSSLQIQGGLADMYSEVFEKFNKAKEEEGDVEMEVRGGGREGEK